MILASGILCYSIHPITKKTYFLLGKGWRNKWTDFAGKPEKGETEMQTAAREFIEESIGVVKLRSDLVSTYPIVLQLLKENGYVCRLTIPMQFKFNGVDLDGLRYCYVFNIPWQPSVNKMFNSQREMLLKNSKTPRSILEIKEISYLDLHQLIRMVRFGGPFKYCLMQIISILYSEVFVRRPSTRRK